MQQPSRDEIQHQIDLMVADPSVPKSEYGVILESWLLSQGVEEPAKGRILGDLLSYEGVI